MINISEVVETNNMIEKENLDVRTITLGISLLDCIDSDLNALNDKIYKKIYEAAKDLVKTGEEISGEFGIPIVNKRISVTIYRKLLRKKIQRIYTLSVSPRDISAESTVCHTNQIGTVRIIRTVSVISVNKHILLVHFHLISTVFCMKSKNLILYIDSHCRFPFLSFSRIILLLRLQHH